MKKNIKIFVSCLVFLCILTAALGKISTLVGRKDSDFKYLDFYEQEEEFDVLFLGSSHVIRSVFPMELWNDYGMVSYNMSNHAETLPETYWVLRNALDYHTPKLVVIDLYKLPLNEKISRDEETGELFKEYLHDYLDSVPLSGTKIQAVWDLLPSEERMEFLFPFSMYHDRWSMLGQGDFIRERSLEKGAQAYAGIVSAEAPEEVHSDRKHEEDTTGKQYLRRMLELCEEKGIQVLLTYIPYGGMTEDDRMWADSGYAVAEQYGVSYENLTEAKGLLNYKFDCSDSNSHLNVSGGRKVTEYLGEYIRTHYRIPDRRNDENYKGWYEAYRIYMEEKINGLSAEDDLHEYLLRLNDQSMSCCYYIRPNSVIYEDELAMELLNNIGDLKRLTEAKDRNEPYLVLADHYDSRVYEFVGDEEFKESVRFGLFDYYTDENGEKRLYIEDSEDNYLTDSKERPSDLHVLVFDNATGEMVDKARFIEQGIMTRKEIKQ